MSGGSTRLRKRRRPLSPLAIALALVLHAFLFGIMFIKVDSHVKPVAAVKSLEVKPDKDVDVIEATAIDNEVLEQQKEKKRAQEREKQRRIEEEKKRKAELERKRKEEIKRKKEEQIKKAEAEKKRKKEAELKRKKEAEKKAAEKKKKEEERKRKLAEEKKRKAAEEKKRKAEAERKRKEAAMKKQMEAKARAARASQALSKYVPRIQQKVEDNWRLPPRPEVCNPTVRVNLAPDGKVLSATIVKSSGDSICDRSVEQAFRKASPIPIPLDPDLYSEFKTIDFPFRP